MKLPPSNLEMPPASNFSTSTMQEELLKLPHEESSECSNDKDHDEAWHDSCSTFSSTTADEDWDFFLSLDSTDLTVSVIPPQPREYSPPPIHDERHVRFSDTVTVHVLNTVLGYHPLCDQYALECGWECLETQLLKLSPQPEERHSKYLHRLTRTERQERLRKSTGWNKFQLLRQDCALRAVAEEEEKDNDGL